MTILSELRLVIVGLLLLDKLSVIPDNKPVFFNCATWTVLAESHSKQLKTKCSLQARIPCIWHTNTSSFLIIPQVVALETAE